QRLGAVARFGGLVALVAQELGQRLPRCGVVVDDEDQAHGLSSLTGLMRPSADDRLGRATPATAVCALRRPRRRTVTTAPRRRWRPRRARACRGQRNPRPATASSGAAAAPPRGA